MKLEKGSVESTHKVPTSDMKLEKGSVESTHKVPTSHYHTNMKLAKRSAQNDTRAASSARTASATYRPLPPTKHCHAQHSSRAARCGLTHRRELQGSGPPTPSDAPSPPTPSAAVRRRRHARGSFPGGLPSLAGWVTASVSISVDAAPDLERSHATILRPLLLGSSLNAA